MSRTYEIVCDPCRKRLWIGQGWPPDRVYLYTGMPKRMQALSDFLFGHIGHRLRFIDSENGDPDYESLDEDEPDEEPR